MGVKFSEHAIDEVHGAYQPEPMPIELGKLKRWLAIQTNAALRGMLEPGRLEQCRSSARCMADLVKAEAQTASSAAAVKAAEAQVRMADVLAAVEHGGAALVMLQRLQDSLAADKPRRVIPGRVKALKAQG